ncbi:MAG: hypothetical protein LC131_13185 [Anaerolineae bacterium]|nr:hypothetical protein [Anaerolineae bacterium]
MMEPTPDADLKHTSRPHSAIGAKTRTKLWRRPAATLEDIRDRRYKKWAELWATIVLTLATLATAWAGYEASRWNGQQGSFNQRATILYIKSGQLATKSQSDLLIDLQVFTNWANAVGKGDTRLADFYRARLRTEFRPAFDAWLATRPLDNPDAPSSPFAMEEYQLMALGQAGFLIEEAGQLTLKAETAGSYADQYTLSVVILAGALLLAGLAQRFEWAELRVIVVAAAMLVLLVSVINIIRLPII